MTTNILRLDVPSFDELLKTVTPKTGKTNACEKQLFVFSSHPLCYDIWLFEIILKTRNSYGLYPNQSELLCWRHVYCSVSG